MKEIKKNYVGAFLLSVVVLTITITGYRVLNLNYQNTRFDNDVEHTDFGLFLATQHALYVNDFDNASVMINDVKSDHQIVKQTKNMADFFSGKMPDNAKSLKDSKDLVEGMIYDAYLIQNDDWKSVYNRHSKDESILAAPLRIFSAVNQNRITETKKFIDSLQTTDSWKSFVRGQIAVLRGDADAAAKEFANVHPEFMNVNDYLYLMSFYKHNEMFEDMEILKNDFVAKLGGMYMVDYPDIPDWENYTGYKNNMVFSIVQTISHTQIMMYTDLSLMFLRFAQIISDTQNMDAIDYYLGQYYFNNAGDYESCFKKVNKSSPLYLFGQLKMAEKNQDIKTIQKIARHNPLFIPAFLIVVNEHVKNGNKSAALSLVNRALKQRDLPEAGRVYFLKQRAHVYLMFNKPDKAQKDVSEIKSIIGNLTLDTMLLQARILEKQNKDLDTAYNYAMNLIKINKSDVNAWDVLGLIVYKREGINNALEIMERIGEFSANSSSVYEHLGDLYVKQGDKERALRSYKHALDLSDDCMVVVPNVQKKIRKLK